MGTRYLGRAAGSDRPAFPEVSEICTATTLADIAVAWAAVLAAIGGMILFLGLG